MVYRKEEKVKLLCCVLVKHKAVEAPRPKKCFKKEGKKVRDCFYLSTALCVHESHVDDVPSLVKICIK